MPNTPHSSRGPSRCSRDGWSAVMEGTRPGGDPEGSSASRGSWEQPRERSVGASQLVEPPAFAGAVQVQRVAAHRPEDVERDPLSEALERGPLARDDEAARVLAEEDLVGDRAVPRRVQAR